MIGDILENFEVLIAGTITVFIFLKIYNYILIKKYNCKELYKQRKKEIKNTKFLKVAKKIYFALIIILIMVVIVFLPYLIVELGISIFVALFGRSEMFEKYLVIIGSILFTIYSIFITYQLYINLLLNKFLKNYKQDN